MSDSLVWCQCTKIGDKIKGDCSDTSVSGRAFANLVCMRLAAQWTDSYPVAEFLFIWWDKLGLPEYPTVYITLPSMIDAIVAAFLADPFKSGLGSGGIVGVIVILSKWWRARVRVRGQFLREIYNVNGNAKVPTEVR